LKLQKAARNRPRDDDGKLMSDSEIAESFGVSRSLVGYARRRFNYEQSKGV
jgi:DNA-binding FadR family transcriptional regulator